MSNVVLPDAHKTIRFIVATGMLTMAIYVVANLYGRIHDRNMESCPAALQICQESAQSVVDACQAQRKLEREAAEQRAKEAETRRDEYCRQIAVILGYTSCH